MVSDPTCAWAAKLPKIIPADFLTRVNQLMAGKGNCKDCKKQKLWVNFSVKFTTIGVMRAFFEKCLIFHVDFTSGR